MTFAGDQPPKGPELVRVPTGSGSRDLTRAVDMPRHHPITLQKPVPGTAFGLVVPGCHVLAAELPRRRLALGMSHALEVMFPIPERYGARRG